MGSKNIRELKIWISGSEGVGKSSFLLQNSFKIVCETEKAIRYTKRYKYNDDSYLIKAVECPLYHHTAEILIDSQAILVCFNLADRTSYDFVKEYIKKLKERVSSKTIFCLVGTFADIADKPKVSAREAEYYCKMNNIEFAEVSCISGYNVKEPLVKILQAFNKISKIEKTEKAPLSENNGGFVGFGTVISFIFIMIYTFAQIMVPSKEF